MALKDDSHIAVWGTGYDGETLIPQNATNVVSIAVGSQNCATIRRDGSVINWGKIKLPIGLSNIAAVKRSSP